MTDTSNTVDENKPVSVLLKEHDGCPNCEGAIIAESAIQSYQNGDVSVNPDTLLETQVIAAVCNDYTEPLVEDSE